MESQIQESIDAVLVLEYKNGDYTQHCSPCFLVAKRGSAAKRLVVDYGEMNRKTLTTQGPFGTWSPPWRRHPPAAARLGWRSEVDSSRWIDAQCPGATGIHHP